MADKYEHLPHFKSIKSFAAKVCLGISIRKPFFSLGTPLDVRTLSPALQVAGSLRRAI